MTDDPRNQLGDISLDGKAYAIMVDTYIQESQPAVYEKYNTGIAQLTDLSILQHAGDHSPFMVTGHHIFAPQTLLDSQGFSLGNNGLTVIKIPLSVASGAYAAMLSGSIVGTNKPVFMFGGRELVWNGSAWSDGVITLTFGFGETQVVYAPPYIYLLKNGKIYYDIPLLDTVSAIKYIGNKLTLPDGSEISIPTNITSLDLVKTNGTGEIIQGRDFQIEGDTGKIKFLENSYAINGAPYTVSYLYQQLADAIKAFSLADSGGVPVSYDLTYDNISSALIYNGVLEDILIPGRDYAIEGNSFSAKLLQPGRYRPGNFAVTYLAMVPQRTTASHIVTSKKIVLDQKRILSCVAYDPSFTNNNLTLGKDYEIAYEQGKIKFTRNSFATIGKDYTITYFYQNLQNDDTIVLTFGSPLTYQLGYENISSAIVYNNTSDVNDILKPNQDYHLEPNTFSVRLLKDGKYRPGNYAITYTALTPAKTTSNYTVTSKKVSLNTKRIISLKVYDPTFTENDLTLGKDYEIQYEQGNIRSTRNSLATIGKSYSVDYTKVTHPTATETLSPASTITLANKRIVEFAIGRQTKQVYFPGRDFEIDKVSGKIRLGQEIRKSMCTTFDLTFKKAVTELAKTKVSIGTGNMEVFEDPAGGKKVLTVPTIHRVLKPYDDGLLWVPLISKNGYTYDAISGTFTFNCRKEDIGTRIWLRGQKYGYTPSTIPCGWNTTFQTIGSNLNPQSINVYAYSTGGVPRQYRISTTSPSEIITGGERITKYLVNIDNETGQPEDDIIIDTVRKKYLIPTGSRLGNIPYNNSIILTFHLIDAGTPTATNITGDAWTTLKTLNTQWIDKRFIVIKGKIADDREPTVIEAYQKYDESSGKFFFSKQSIAYTEIKAYYSLYTITLQTATVSSTSEKNTWINIPGLSYTDLTRILDNTTTATREEQYVFKYRYGVDWNYDPDSGIIFFNRMTNCGSELQKLIETVSQSWENKNFTTLPNGNNILLREVFPSDPSDYPIYTYNWGPPFSGGSYTDYWAYQNWRSHLVMQQVMSDFDDRFSEQIGALTPRWWNIQEGTIRVDETVDLRKQTGGQEIYVSYIRGTITDVTESGLTIADGWIDLTGITDYKDIDLDTLSIELDGFWAYKENIDYLLNREAGILTAFEGSGIACAANADLLKAYYNYELYTPVSNKIVTASYNWQTLEELPLETGVPPNVLNRKSPYIVPRSERVYFTIDETYKGRKLYFTEQTPYNNGSADYTFDPDSSTLYVVDGGRIIEGQTIGIEMINYDLSTKTIASKALTYDFAELVGTSEYWKPIPGSEVISYTPARLLRMDEGVDYILERETGNIKRVESGHILSTDNLIIRLAYFDFSPSTETVTASHDWVDLTHTHVIPRSEILEFTISELYKARKLYFTEGVDYNIDPESGTMYILDGGRILEGGTVGLEIVNYELETKTISSQALAYNFALLVGDSEYWKAIPGSEIISTTPARLMLMEENADYVIDRGTGWIKRIENGRILTTDNLTARLTYFNIINHSQAINASYAWQNLTYPKIATQAARVQYTPGINGHPNYSFVFQKDVDYSVEPESGVITATPFNRFTATDILSMTHQYLDLQAKLTQLIADGQAFSPVDSGIACEKLTVGAQILGINEGKVFNLQGKTAVELINFGGTTVNGIAYFYGQALAFGHTNIDNRDVGFIASLAGEKLVTLDQELTTNSSVTAVAESGHLYFAAGTCIYEYMGNNEYKKLYDHGAAIDSMRFINNKLYYSSVGSIYLFQGGTNYAEASFITGALNAGFRNVDKLFRQISIEFDNHPTGTLTIQAFENYKRLKDSFAESFVEHSTYDIPVTWDKNYLIATVPDKLTGADLYLRLKYERPVGEAGSEFSIKSYDVEFIPLGELKLDWRVTIRAQMGIKFRDMKVETRTPKEILDQINTLKEGNIPITFRSLHGEDYSVLIDKITTEGMSINPKQGEALITLTLFEC